MTLWENATRDLEAEELDRKLTGAREAALEVTSFLFNASSPAEYENRKALVADKLDKAASAVTLNDPVGFAVIRAKLEGSLDQDFFILAEARDVSKKTADAKMVYDEWYGELTYAQRAAYRKHNISPSDHDSLVDAFGNDADAIVAEIKRQTADGGMFSFFNIGRGGGNDFWASKKTALEWTATEDEMTYTAPGYEIHAGDNDGDPATLYVGDEEFGTEYDSVVDAQDAAEDDADSKTASKKVASDSDELASRVVRAIDDSGVIFSGPMDWETEQEYLDRAQWFLEEGSDLHLEVQDILSGYQRREYKKTAGLPTYEPGTAPERDQASLDAAVPGQRYEFTFNSRSGDGWAGVNEGELRNKNYAGTGQWWFTNIMEFFVDDVDMLRVDAVGTHQASVRQRVLAENKRRASLKKKAWTDAEVDAFVDEVGASAEIEKKLKAMDGSGSIFDAYTDLIDDEGDFDTFGSEGAKKQAGAFDSDLGYGWVVTQGWDDGSIKDVEIFGPNAIPDATRDALKAGGGGAFQLWDDDGELMAKGRWFEGQDGMGYNTPLDDIGMGMWGAARMTVGGNQPFIGLKTAEFRKRVKAGLKRAERHTDDTGAFRVDVAGVRESTWSSNSVTWDTEEEAKRAASDLMSRWMGADMARIVPSSTPKGETIDMDDPSIVENWRKSGSKRGTGRGSRRAASPRPFVKKAEIIPSPRGRGQFKIEWDGEMPGGGDQFTLFYMADEESPFYGVWDTVSSRPSKEELLDFIQNPPEWFGTLSSRKTAGAWVDEGSWAYFESEGIGEGSVSPVNMDDGVDAYAWDAFTYDSLPERGSGQEDAREDAKAAVEEWVKQHAAGDQMALFAKKQAEFTGPQFDVDPASFTDGEVLEAISDLRGFISANKWDDVVWNTYKERLRQVVNEAMKRGIGEFADSQLVAASLSDRIIKQVAKKTASTPSDVLDSIQGRDPDGGERMPTEADYARFEDWIRSTYGEQALKDYRGWGKSEDILESPDEYGTYSKKKTAAPYGSFGYALSPEGEKLYVGEGDFVSDKSQAVNFGFFETAEQMAWSLAQKKWGAENEGPMGGVGGDGTWNAYAENNFDVDYGAAVAGAEL